MFDAMRDADSAFDDDLEDALESANDMYSDQNERGLELSGAAAAILAEAEFNAELSRDESRSNSIDRGERTRPSRSL